MKSERKRIFISNLPEVATESEIQKIFSDYGNVVSIEIKERKELSTKHSSHFFAYVNIEIDDKTLQQCFKDFSNEKWLGQYVYLQLARESFLDRLKREREENAVIKPNALQAHESPKIVPQAQLNGLKASLVKQEDSSDSSEDETVSKPILKQPNGLKSTILNKSSDESSDSSENEAMSKERQIKSETLNVKKDELNSIYDPDIIIKNNRNKTLSTDGLKIESFGMEPIVKMEKTKKKPDVNTSEANLKRLESLKNLKRGYQNQKSLIQAALSAVDTKRNNKIIFNDDLSGNQPSKRPKIDGESKKSLFDEDSEDEHFEGNFNVKEQFQGKGGEKLLVLQSKYKNDKRFQLDTRFLDGNNETLDSHENVNEDEEMTVEEEVRKEYEILNEVLGKKFTPKLDNKVESQKKTMLRFDPTQPDHSKFEVQRPVVEKEKKRNKRNIDESLETKKHEETSTPEVSKEVFYKVHDDLKESLLEKKQEFSLLNLFGTAASEKEEGEEAEQAHAINDTGLPKEKNPFRYDSSDDEDETENIPTHENTEEMKVDVNNENNSLPRKNFWVEPFFFGKDDYRLQEGYDFLEKMKCEDKGEFRKLRRDIKEIVKAKVRNNQRKNKPFKKKLGGNRKKKVLRMKKALKR